MFHVLQKILVSILCLVTAFVFSVIIIVSYMKYRIITKQSSYYFLVVSPRYFNYFSVKVMIQSDLLG